ncbi:MAG: rhomboid family intramembrane serine protease [Gemmataceae bacterium]|nr:rhomboid family intramembrane serine protease [Gemmataceae bacterium]
MGLLDRDSYRDPLDDDRGYGLGDSVMCNLIVVGLLGVFAAQALSTPVLPFIPEDERIELFLPYDIRIDGFTRSFALDPAATAQGHVWRPLTSALLHHPPLPDARAIYLLVAWNLALFWLAGRSLEWRLGLPELLGFFLVAGLAGNLLAVAGALLLPAWGPAQPILASPAGAVAGVLVLAALLFPVTTLGRLRFPTWVLPFLYAGVHAATFSLRLRTGEHPGMLLGGGLFAWLYWRYGWSLRRLLQGLAESGPRAGR